MIHLTSNSPVFAMEKAKKEEESNQVYSALPFLLFDHKNAKLFDHKMFDGSGR